MHGPRNHICILLKKPHVLEKEPPMANIFQKQVFRLQALCLPCEWHHGTKREIRSLKRLRTQQAKQLNHPFIWHPYSAIKFYWDFFHLFILFAAFVYMPFQVFVTCPPRSDGYILLSDVLMFVNICTFFITGYIVEDKTVELRSKNIARHYIRTYLIFDVIGALPLQFCFESSNCMHPSHTTMLIFKLFRISSLFRQWRNVIGQLEVSYLNYMTLKIFVMTLMFIHWMTYIHYQIPALIAEFDVPVDTMEGWSTHYYLAHFNEDGMFRKYTINVYVVCGLCIGAGHYTPLEHNFIPEMLSIAFMGLSGLFIVAYTYSSMLRISVYMTFDAYLFIGKYRQLQQYMEWLRLPKYLKDKLNLFIDYKYNANFYNEEAIMHTINAQIKQDINMFACKDLVMTVPLFRDTPTAFINSIVFNMKQVLYMPGDIIVKYGEPAKSLMLISAGTVAAVNEWDREVAHLRDGAYFGENSLRQINAKRGATMIALEITEIYMLKKEQFDVLLKPYPQLIRLLDNNRLSDGNALSRY